MGFFEKLFKSEVKKIISKNNAKRSGLSEKLEYVAANSFPEYELRKEISASEMGAGHEAKNYSYGLYKNGEPKAFMMIISDRNQYRKKEIRLAKEAAEWNGVPYMNFFSHLPNEETYIDERIRKNLFA